MLHECAECGRPVSSRAISCPGCGSPAPAGPDIRRRLGWQFAFFAGLALLGVTFGVIEILASTAGRPQPDSLLMTIAGAVGMYLVRARAREPAE